MRAATTSLISGEPWWTEAKTFSLRHQHAPSDICASYVRAQIEPRSGNSRYPASMEVKVED